MNIDNFEKRPIYLLPRLRNAVNAPDHTGEPAPVVDLARYREKRREIAAQVSRIKRLDCDDPELAEIMIREAMERQRVSFDLNGPDEAS